MRVSRRLAQRALQRQLEYQKGLAERFRSDPAAVGGQKRAAVEELFSHAVLAPDARVLEVGGGGKGMLFYLPPAGLRVGADPLAVDYSVLFPTGTAAVSSCAAFGENLPFRDAAFDLVLCDNVIDHAEQPSRIVSESIRVLKDDGILYFTVNVHHPIYHHAAALYRTCAALGVRLEIGPFADHTVHLRRRDVQRMFADLPLRVRYERDGVAQAIEKAKVQPPRHAFDRLKRVFFKNARYVIVASKQARERIA